MAQQHHGNPTYGMAQPTSQPSRAPASQQEALLLIYMVDYCEKRQYNEAATALKKEGRLQQAAKPPIESKEGLLLEWWICFWNIYTARVHPHKSTDKVAKLYAESLRHSPFMQSRDTGQPSNARMGGGPAQPGGAAQPTPGVNGQVPSGTSYSTNPPGMNGAQPPPTNSGALPGIPGANPSLHNPALQHLQHLQPRITGYPAQGQGMQMQPIYVQRTPGAPMGPMGQMGPMSQAQQRIPNGVVYAQHPNYRPQQPGQQSPQQEMQTAGAPGSPKQPGAPSKVENSSPHLQGANGNIYDASEANHQGAPRNQPSRGQKRSSPAEDDQYSKDASPPDRKKPRRSPQEHGPTLPTTPLASSQPPSGNGRPPMQTGAFNGVPPNKLNPMMASMSFPAQGMTNGPPLGGPGMPPAMAGQLRELTQTHTQHAQRAQGTPSHQHQTDQQYFAQMQQTAVNTYNIKQTYPQQQQNPALTGPPGVAAEPAVRGATSAPKGSMLPPPPPGSSTGQPTPGTGNTTPSKNTPVMSGLQPRGAGNKDGSSPGEGVSLESARPGSRPIPGSTPQMTPAPIPGTASTPGGPSAISAPSPNQMATPQQISRPQTQSPSQVAIPRPPSATTNGLVGGPPNPSALLATRYGGGVPPGGTNGAAGGVQAGSTPSNPGMGGSTEMLGGGALTNDLFTSLNSNMPFEFQMMGYQEDDTFGTSMGLDFGTNFGMDGNYDMSVYLNESSLDSVNGS